MFKGVNLTIKADVVEHHPMSSNTPAASSEGIPEVVYFHAEKSSENQYTQPDMTKKTPSGRPTKFPEMERELCKWIDLCHDSG